jgi:hypothetical protein
MHAKTGKFARTGRKRAVPATRDGSAYGYFRNPIGPIKREINSVAR